MTVVNFTSAQSDDSYFWGLHPMAVATGRLEVGAGLQGIRNIAATKLDANTPRRPRRILGATAAVDLSTGRNLQYVALEDDADVMSWLAAVPSATLVTVLYILYRANSLLHQDSPAPPASTWLP
jgi:hypothetical protein